MQNEEPQNLHALQNIIRVMKPRRMRRVNHVERTRDKCIQNFGRKPEGKRLLGRYMRR
jgi:hypothetical protein